MNDLHGGYRWLRGELLIWVFLINRIVCLVLITLHRIFQFVQHILPFLITVHSGTYGVICTRKLELRSLTFLNHLRSLKLIRWWRVILIIWYHDIVVILKTIVFFISVSWRAKPLFQTFEQASIFIEVFTANNVSIILPAILLFFHLSNDRLLFTIEYLSKVDSSLENLRIRWRQFICPGGTTIFATPCLVKDCLRHYSILMSYWRMEQLGFTFFKELSWFILLLDDSYWALVYTNVGYDASIRYTYSEHSLKIRELL